MKKFFPKCKVLGNRIIYLNPREQTLAIKASIFGFNLYEFDTWLMGLDELPAKKELIQRRKEAIDAKSISELRRHLEFLHLRCLSIRREDFLLPKAIAGDKANKKQQKNAKKLRGLRPDTVVIYAAMRVAKADGLTLKQFLRSAKNKSVENIRANPSGDKYRFEIKVGLGKEILRESSKKTIEGWWTECDGSIGLASSSLTKKRKTKQN